MNILIFGATGWVGGQFVQEALQRGHRITAVVRNPAKLTTQHSHLRVVEGDVTNVALIEKIAGDYDVVLASVTGRATQDQSIFVRAAEALLQALKTHRKTRLFWVGGAGSLDITAGKRLVDAPNFPEMYRAEALAQADALDYFKRAKTEVNWTVLSPAALLEPGTRTGNYRLGRDQLLSNEKGESRISVNDFAVAIVDELEQGKHLRQRFTVAY